MKLSEKFLNFCFGLSLIYWGIAGYLLNHEEFYNASFVRVFITVLNLTVGILIISRKPVIKATSFFSTLISLPSLICGGLLFKLSNPLLSWSIYSEILFVLGGSIALISFLFLGRNFSIFPELRTITSKGLFRIVRHPSYLGETIMISACLLEAESYISIIAFVVFIPGIIIRIKEEEKLLFTSVIYQKYTKSVKWKLIPYIW